MNYLEKQKNTLDRNVLLLNTYFERCELFIKTGDYINALICIQNGINCDEHFAPLNMLFIACFYFKISSICSKNGNYDTALCFLQKSLTIYQTSIPPSSEVFIL